MAFNTRYSKLLSERKFLKVAQRARALNGSRLVSIEYDDSMLIFKTESASRPGLFHIQKLFLKDLADHIMLIRLYEKEKSKDKTRDFFSNAHRAMMSHMKPIAARDLKRALRETPIRCSCTCEADLYWGFRYIRWRIGAGLVPERRRPKVRNPEQRGYVCKHLFSVLTLYPTILPYIERLLIRKGLIRENYEHLKSSEDGKR